MILFVLGVIVGLLLNPAKTKVIEKLEKYKEIPKGETKFFESMTDKEKWNKAKNINDLLN